MTNRKSSSPAKTVAAVRAAPAKRKKAVAEVASPPGGRSSERREQQRSIESRLAILDAALAEFADKGFDGASMRDIGERTGLHYTLITYHFRTKETLWKATAEHFFSEIAEMWETEAPILPGGDPIDRIRDAFHALMRFLVAKPSFHHFMVRESRESSPRFTWLMETFLTPVMRRMIPQIEEAQEHGDLPAANPVMIYYLMIGIISTPSALGAEIRYNSGLNPTDPEVVEGYWKLVDQIVFRRKLYDRSG